MFYKCRQPIVYHEWWKTRVFNDPIVVDDTVRWSVKSAKDGILTVKSMNTKPTYVFKTTSKKFCDNFELVKEK